MFISGSFGRTFCFLDLSCLGSEWFRCQGFRAWGVRVYPQKPQEVSKTSERKPFVLLNRLWAVSFGGC